MELPLPGLGIVAFEQAVAAPCCIRYLADLGADVVKVERPDGGNFARRDDSAVKGEPAHFAWLSRGKRSTLWFEAKSSVGPLRALAHPITLVGAERRRDAVSTRGERTEEIRRELGRAPRTAE